MHHWPMTVEQLRDLREVFPWEARAVWVPDDQPFAWIDEEGEWMLGQDAEGNLVKTRR